MDQTLRHEILAVLEAGKDLSLATLRADGAPQATVVSYVSDGLSIYIGCAADSQKAANLARDPRVSLTITLPYERWDKIRGVSLFGEAERLEDPDHTLTIGRLFLTKFPELAQAIRPGEIPMALFCVTPLIVSLLDYRKGFGHVEHVEAGELTAPSPSPARAASRPCSPPRDDVKA